MSTLRWAVYLGVSWTWCIGMFLPVLLVRDYGVWAFVVFAVPNVLGAAAMPWVVKSAEASRAIVAAHRGPMISFSRITIAFQAFFAGWMLPQLLGWWVLTLYPLLLLALVFAVRRDREFLTITTVVALLSAALAAAFIGSNFASFPAPRGIDGAAMLAPVCVLGFLLCPYLDLTFHHVLQKTEDARRNSSRAAFALGFGVVFASMIVFTLLYAGALLSGGSALAGYLIGTHMAVQLVATVLLHQVRAGVVSGRKGGLPLLPVLAAAFAVGVICYFLPPIAGWAAGEYVYRGFLVFYGLLFPAYVLLRIIPDTPAPWRLVGATVLTALPLYSVGFYTQHVSFLLWGTGVVLLGWILATATRSGGAIPAGGTSARSPK